MTNGLSLMILSATVSLFYDYNVKSRLLEWLRGKTKYKYNQTKPAQ